MRPLSRSKRIWENDIRINLRKMAWKLRGTSQNRNKTGSFVNKVKNIFFAQEEGIS
jgi:hypothetical protein